MAHVVIMPKQGQSVESCIVTEFKKKVGDKVAVGDVLFSYETDKASFDEDAKVEGTVLACFFNDNDEIPCLTNVMVIGEPGESFSEYAPSGAGASAASGAEPTSPATEPANAVAEPVARQGSPAIEVTAAATPGASASPATGTVAANAPVSPRARKLAAEKGVDTAQVAGTGPHGRIIERDIIAAQGAPKSGLAKAMMADGGLQAPAAGSGLGGMVKGSDLKVWKPTHTGNLAGVGEEFKVEKMSNMRKLIAKSMYNSLQNTAQLNSMRFLFEPGKALAKAGLFNAICTMQDNAGNGTMLLKAGRSTHLYFTDSQDNASDFGKTFKIIGLTPFCKQGIRDFSAKYPRAEVSARNLPLTSEELRRKLKVQSGGDIHIFGLHIDFCHGASANYLAAATRQK